jgi:hypothetical protein
MRCIAITFIVAVMATASIAQVATVEPLSQSAVLAPFLDTSRPEWQRLEAARDIEFDPETGNYRIYWKSWDGARKFWVFEPASKVKVKVDAQVTRDASGAYIYRYSVHNLDSSPQNCDWFMVRYDGAEIYAVVQPDPLWAFFPQVGMVDAREPVAAWAAELWPDATEADVPGIPAGGSAAAFGFTSREPPGLVTCYAVGYVRRPKFWDPDSEAIPNPRPKLLGDCAIGTTIGPVPERVARANSRWVSVRQAVAPLGYALYWNPLTRSVRVSRRGATIVFSPGQRAAEVNGRVVRLSAAPKLEKGRVLLLAADLREILSVRAGLLAPARQSS